MLLKNNIMNAYLLIYLSKLEFWEKGLVQRACFTI